MLIKVFDSRQMEDYLAENAVAQLVNPAVPDNYRPPSPTNSPPTARNSCAA